MDLDKLVADIIVLGLKCGSGQVLVIDQLRLKELLQAAWRDK